MMRMQLLASTAVLLLAATTASAQPANQAAPDTMTCANFTELEAGAQAAFLQGYTLGRADMAADAPAAQAARNAAPMAADDDDDDAAAPNAAAGNAAAGANAPAGGQPAAGGIDVASITTACEGVPDNLMRDVLQQRVGGNP